MSCFFSDMKSMPGKRESAQWQRYGSCSFVSPISVSVSDLTLDKKCFKNTTHKDWRRRESLYSSCLYTASTKQYLWYLFIETTCKDSIHGSEITLWLLFIYFFCRFYNRWKSSRIQGSFRMTSLFVPHFYLSFITFITEANARLGCATFTLFNLFLGFWEFFLPFIMAPRHTSVNSAVFMS